MAVPLDGAYCPPFAAAGLAAATERMELPPESRTIWGGYCRALVGSLRFLITTFDARVHRRSGRNSRAECLVPATTVAILSMPRWP